LLGWPGFCAADGAFARKTTLLLGAARKSLYFSGLAQRLA
jgi:hypothetical protein